MPWTNPVVAGEELIRNAIRSENFSEDTGIGWRVARNGDATFNNVNSSGNASGPSASYDSVSANESLIYRGDEMADLLAGKAGGVAAWAVRTDTLSIPVGQKLGWFGLDFIRQPDHLYLLTTSSFQFETDGKRFCTIRIQQTLDGTLPTLTSDEITQLHIPSGRDDGGQWTVGSLFWPFQPVDTVTPCRLLFAGENSPSATGAATISSPSGSLDVIVYDMGTVVTLTDQSYDNDGSGTVVIPPGNGTWNELLLTSGESYSYNANGSVYNHNDYMYQGHFGSFHDNQFSMVWFHDDTDPKFSDMVGATEWDYLDVYIFMDHWYYYSGGTLEVGWSQKPNEGGSASEADAHGQRKEVSYSSRNQGKWISLLDTEIPDRIADGSCKAIQIGKAPSNSEQYYGYAHGNNQNHEPQLRARYRK